MAEIAFFGIGRGQGLVSGSKHHVETMDTPGKAKLIIFDADFNHTQIAMMNEESDKPVPMATTW